MKTVIAGVLIEAVLFAAMNMAPSGPCGPATQWGVLLVLLHIPSAAILYPVAWMLPDERWVAPLWFVSSSLIWALLIHGCLALVRSLRP
ncbi:hypothetical protein [Prosthecobacter vanneervenii]|uniref:Uncharacterized protein n=1 Tax=Prosthecobacter vanneervenii TaxID=48466 RepID=A0A7W8DMU6_9BACT|nr:hypothetical protein [Prosthecobacter vanneervenii]MBB5035642.1 hypothetical protein [Prosthecobacter vanneervenii]